MDGGLTLLLTIIANLGAIGTLISPIIKLHSRLDVMSYRIDQQSKMVDELSKELRTLEKSLTTGQKT